MTGPTIWWLVRYPSGGHDIARAGSVPASLCRFTWTAESIATRERRHPLFIDNLIAWADEDRRRAA